MGANFPGPGPDSCRFVARSANHCTIKIYYIYKKCPVFVNVLTSPSLTQISPSRVMFQLIPSCLVAREASELRHKRCQTAGAIVESVVRDLCHTLHQTGGVLGLIPRPIIHVFNSNACRGECSGLQLRKIYSGLLEMLRGLEYTELLQNGITPMIIRHLFV